MNMKTLYSLTLCTRKNIVNSDKDPSSEPAFFLSIWRPLFSQLLICAWQMIAYMLKAEASKQVIPSFSMSPPGAMSLMREQYGWRTAIPPPTLHAKERRQLLKPSGRKAFCNSHWERMQCGMVVTRRLLKCV